MPKAKIIVLSLIAIIGVFVVIQVINASKYDMVVNVVDGENVLGLNPLTERLDFGDLSRNNRMARQITIANGGSMDSYVIVWKFGEVSDLVHVDKNFFTVKSKEESKISFEVGIPPSAETRKYEGGVWIFRVPKPI